MTEVAPRNLQLGLSRAGKQRSDVHVLYMITVAPNRDWRQSVQDARLTSAFYGSMAQYQSYFEAHGFDAEAKQLQHDAAQQKPPHELLQHVPDEMASTFVVTGTPDAVRRKIEPVWAFADSVLLMPVSGLTPEETDAYLKTIAETFYS